MTREEAQELVVLALGTDGFSSTVAGIVPQHVYNRLHERGLLATGRDVTDEGFTYTTIAGQGLLEQLFAMTPE